MFFAKVGLYFTALFVRTNNFICACFLNSPFAHLPQWIEKTRCSFGYTLRQNFLDSSMVFSENYC